MKKWRLKDRRLQETLDRNSDPNFGNFSQRLNFVMRNRLPGSTECVYVEHVFGHTGTRIGRKALRFRVHEIEEYEE